MKKILAGVLAAASLMAVTVTASATTKDVTKAGDISYNVTAKAPAVVLKLKMPAKLEAALNPFGADIKLDKLEEPTTTNKGIASVAYDVTNKSSDYGVFLSATAITTITTTDVAADKTANWVVDTNAVVDDGSAKSAQMALVAAADAPALSKLTVPTASKAAGKTAQGCLVMDSTVAKDDTNKLPAGYTTQSKFAYVPAATADEEEQKIVLGFIGALASGTDATKGEIVWYDDDAINVNLVIKVTAGPKVFA